MDCSFYVKRFLWLHLFILVFFDDLQFSFSVFTKMNIAFNFVCHACIVMKMLTTVVHVNKDMFPNCVKFLLAHQL